MLFLNSNYWLNNLIITPKHLFSNSLSLIMRNEFSSVGNREAIGDVNGSGSPYAILRY